jgi:hypothetical protein
MSMEKLFGRIWVMLFVLCALAAPALTAAQATAWPA